MNIGDRMKFYEKRLEIEPITTLPICIRLDGRNFSAFTRNFAKPYDPFLHGVMVEVTKKLVEESNAIVGYTQSDEITLVLWNKHQSEQFFFGGKTQKLNSVLASVATYWFTRILSRDWSMPPAYFDCRSFQVPSLEEAANCVLWRVRDCVKNSITLLASKYYSHRQLNEKNSSEKQELIFQAGDNWNDWPLEFKEGTFVLRKTVKSKMSQGEIDNLPPLHNARKYPDMEFERNVIIHESIKYSSISSDERVKYIIGE